MKTTEMKTENILVITFWSYKDALVQTYALPYVKMIRELLPKESKIFIVTFEQPQMSLTEIEREATNIELNKINIELVAFPYKRFGIKKLIASLGHVIAMIKIVKGKKIDTIHAFGPNAGSYGYLVSKITGKDLVIDSFEPHAEAMVENGTWKRNGIAHFILGKFEKLQAKRAKHLIGTSSGMYDYSIKNYGYEPKSFFVKPACVDTRFFYPRKKDVELVNDFKLDGKIVCVYAGKLGGIYLEEEFFDFLKTCFEFWGDSFRCVMVTNADRKLIDKLMYKVDLPARVLISRFVPHDQVPRYLSLGDFAINPVKPVPTKRYCTSIKDGEYWAMGLPVVISPNISDDSEIISREDIGGVTNFTNKENMLNVIKKINVLISIKNNQKEKIVSIAKKYRSYGIAQKIYTEIYA